MRLSQHPEYDIYLQATETDRCCRRAVDTWKASGEPIVVEAYGLCWTFERAQALVRSLSRLFQAYNRVLWERFSYCRACEGECCVLHATRVGRFDALALALLEQPMPVLPQDIAATERDCVYHTAEGCAWPADWRPIKCWAFYCARGESTGPIVEELGKVVHAFMPEALRRYEAVTGEALVTYLDDPVDFSSAFTNALTRVFVAPLNDQYPVIDEGTQENHESNPRRKRKTRCWP